MKHSLRRILAFFGGTGDLAAVCSAGPSADGSTTPISRMLQAICGMDRKRAAINALMVTVVGGMSWVMVNHAMATRGDLVRSGASAVDRLPEVVDRVLTQTFGTAREFHEARSGDFGPSLGRGTASPLGHEIASRPNANFYVSIQVPKSHMWHSGPAFPPVLVSVPARSDQGTPSSQDLQCAVIRASVFDRSIFAVSIYRAASGYGVACRQDWILGQSGTNPWRIVVNPLTGQVHDSVVVGALRAKYPAMERITAARDMDFPSSFLLDHRGQRESADLLTQAEREAREGSRQLRFKRSNETIGTIVDGFRSLEPHLRDVAFQRIQDFYRTDYAGASSPSIEVDDEMYEPDVQDTEAGEPTP